MENGRKLYAVLEAKGFDGAVLMDEVSQHWVTGFYTTDGVVIVTAKETLLITDSRYIEAAEASRGEGFCVSAPKDMCEAIADIFKKEGVKTVAFEESRVTYAMLEKLKERISAEFVP